MPVPDNFRCEECGAILREMREAWQADQHAVRLSSRNPTELLQEWLSADDYQMAKLAVSQYPRTLAVRRRRTEHEVLTGHSILTHGWRALFGPRI